MRRYQLATAAVLIVIAAVAMFDTRGGALPDASGGAPGGLKGGWYPFWSAALMAAAAAVVAYLNLRAPASAAAGASAGRKGVLALLLLIAPMIAAVVAMVWLGFYLVSLVYVAFFTAVVGRYRPHWVAATALGMTAALYVVFELGFRVPLPKSVFSKMGFPF